MVWGDRKPLIAQLLRRRKGAVPVTTQPHEKHRGIAARRALLAIVRARAEADLPMPPYQTMARAIGISAGQVSRHMAVLMDEGAFTTRCAGMHTRIEEVQQ